MALAIVVLLNGRAESAVASTSTGVVAYGRSKSSPLRPAAEIAFGVFVAVVVIVISVGLPRYYLSCSQVGPPLRG